MIIRNAIKNLGRNSGRTILIGTVVGIIMIASACTMIVHSSAKQMAQKQMEVIGAQVIIVRNDDKLTGNGDLSNYREISVTQMMSFTTSSLIQSSEIYGSTVGKAELKTIAGTGVGNSVEEDHGGEEGISVPGMEEFDSPNVLLLGSTHKEINEDFKNGTRKITQGRMYQKKNEVVIGEALAKKNNLKVGDHFSVSLIDLADGGNIPKITVTIAGIFEDYKQTGDGDIGSLNKNNEIFMSYDTLLSMPKSDGSQGGFAVEGSFLLKHPEDVKALEQEFHKKGMPEYFELSVNKIAYEKSVAPLVQIANMTQIFTLVVLGAGALMVIALSLLAIRERKYEIGVLRAMGMKKRDISIMLCMEMCMLCLLCGGVALVFASVLAQPVADLMLSHTSTSETIQFGAFFIGSGGAAEVTTLPAQLSMSAILSLLIAAVVLGLMGSIAGVRYVMKHEPMRILAERN